MRKAGVLAAASAMTACGALSAVAQTTGAAQTTTVMTRPRPELDPLGMHVGGFLVYPKLGVGEDYNDNIYATQNSTIHDFITTISPGVQVNSNWNNDSLQFHANSDIARYNTHTEENYEHYDVGTNGRLDILRDMNATAGVRFQHLTEKRGTPNAVDGSEPTKYNLATGDLGFFNRWNRVSLKLGTQVQQYKYWNTPTSSGTPIDNHDRDRKEYQANIRGGYQIVPGYGAYTQLILTDVRYDQTPDNNGVDRDNSGYEVRAGARIDLTGLMFGDVYAGYLNRDYKDPSLKTVSGVSAGTNITWNVTPLTTVIGTVSRTVQETTQAGASGILDSSATARVDHELLRNLILSASFGYTRDNYEGTSRRDNYLNSMIQARYMMNRNLYLTLKYGNTNRTSNAANSDFKQNVVTLNLRAQL